jgi:hypothetical protein
MAAAAALAAAAAAAVAVVVVVVMVVVMVVVVFAAVVDAISDKNFWRSGSAVLVGFGSCQHHLCCDCHLAGPLRLYGQLLSGAHSVCTIG